MDMSWPSQNAQPFGAKLKGNMRTSATNGLDMGASGGRREKAVHGDDEVHAQIRLHVVVRLRASGASHRVRCDCQRRVAASIELGRRLARHVVRWAGLRGDVV